MIQLKMLQCPNILPYIFLLLQICIYITWQISDFSNTRNSNIDTLKLFYLNGNHRLILYSVIPQGSRGLTVHFLFTTEKLRLPSLPSNCFPVNYTLGNWTNLENYHSPLFLEINETFPVKKDNLDWWQLL